MRRISSFVVALCLLGACESPPPPDVPTEAPDWVKEGVERSQRQAEGGDELVVDDEVELLMQKPLMWRIEAKGGATSHVLGSFHLATDFRGLPYLPVSVREAFEASDSLVLEADTGVADLDPLLPFTVLPKGKSLRKMLKPAHWEVLVRETQLSAPQLERMPPWIVTSLLLFKWLDAGEWGMDDRFRILGRAHEKDLVFLETAAQQGEMMSKVVTPAQLEEMLLDVDAAKAELRQALVDFRAGDAAAVEAWVFDPQKVQSSPAFYEALFYTRNANWAELLQPRLDAGGVLVVVGAGHLVGERSLIAMLEANDYQITRVE